ncbi:hypothetical protein SASPL_141402 [Salvia splendens]|uniref:Uncharacterized protein n=1 Tax=Salvia splendens TaxID=180675 RepID=A0A8X8ZCR7_SALSN|nr:hypothetical protein SASPL_141402 [Salvia splendens]
MAPLPGKHGVILCLCVVGRYHRGGHWNHPLIYRGANAHWRVQRAGVVTTRYKAALEAAAAAKQNTQPPPPPPERTEADMNLVDNDSGIGVMTVLSHFYGLSKECPYAFLEEFCRYCDIQPIPPGSTSEDYRLKAIPFVLKGEAGVWL